MQCEEAISLKRSFKFQVSSSLNRGRHQKAHGILDTMLWASELETWNLKHETVFRISGRAEIQEA
jgi:hypothetical protein